LSRRAALRFRHPSSPTSHVLHHVALPLRSLPGAEGATVQSTACLDTAQEKTHVSLVQRPIAPTYDPKSGCVAPPSHGFGWDGERASERFKTEWALRTKFPGVELRQNLDKYLWVERDHVSLAQLAEWFARYLYLPRVTNRGVLEAAVQDGASVLNADDTFALAAGCDETKKRYTGLKVGEGQAGVVDRAQREREKGGSSPPGRHDSGEMQRVDGQGAHRKDLPPLAPKLPPNVFIGSVMDRMDRNQDIATAYFNESEFATRFFKVVVRRVYDEIRKPGSQPPPSP
jgi:hypothetical protein